jgi:hypothetical protein
MPAFRRVINLPQYGGRRRPAPASNWESSRLSSSNLNDAELDAVTSPQKTESSSLASRSMDFLRRFWVRSQPSDLGPNVQAVADNTEKLIAKLHPQVIVTWGPDGGYGHPDHRLVSSAVTQVIQSENSGIKLYYAGLTPEQAKLLDDAWPYRIQWHTTNPAYLTVSVPFTNEDQAASHRAFECHKSQFVADSFRKIEKALDDGWAGHVSLRAWSSLRIAELRRKLEDDPAVPRHILTIRKTGYRLKL